MRSRSYLMRLVSIVLIMVLSSIILIPSATKAESNQPLTLVWQTDFTPETMLASPGDIAIDQWGNVFVSTQSGNGVKKFDSEGKFVLQWGGAGKGEGKFSLSLGIAVDAEGNVYVTDFYNRRIQKFDGNGKFLAMWDSEQSTSPAFMDIDAAGNIYLDLFPSHDEHYIQKLDTSGKLWAEWGSTKDRTLGGRLEDLAIGPDGNLYIADPLLHRVHKIDPNGKVLAVFGGEMSSKGNGQFYDPFGIGLDGEGNIYVLDSMFLQKLDPQGNFITQWSAKEGLLEKAKNVRVDHKGNIYVFATAEVTLKTGKTAKVPLLKKLSQGSAAW